MLFQRVSPANCTQLHKMKQEKQDGPLDFIFRLYNFHQVISSTPTFFCRIFSLLKSNLKAWEHCLVEKLTNTENRTTDLGTCDTFLLIFRVPVKKADYQICLGGYVDASHTMDQTFSKSNVEVWAAAQARPSPTVCRDLRLACGGRPAHGPAVCLCSSPVA